MQVQFIGSNGHYVESGVSYVVLPKGNQGDNLVFYHSGETYVTDDRIDCIKDDDCNPHGKYHMMDMNAIINHYEPLQDIDLRNRNFSKNDSIQDIMSDYITNSGRLPETDSEIIDYIDSHISELESKGILTEENINFYGNISDTIRSYEFDNQICKVDGNFCISLKVFVAQTFINCHYPIVPAEIWKKVYGIAEDYELDEDLKYLIEEIYKAISDNLVLTREYYLH